MLRHAVAQNCHGNHIQSHSIMADGSATEALAALERLALAAPAFADRPSAAPVVATSDDRAPPSKKPHRAGQPPPGGQCDGIAGHMVTVELLQYMTLMRGMARALQTDVANMSSTLASHCSPRSKTFADSVSLD